MSRLACRVRIAIDGIPRRDAEAVRRALEPDNVDFPEGLSVDIEADNVDNRLVITCQNDGSGQMGHLVGTVDEVLEHVQVALGVIGR